MLGAPEEAGYGIQENLPNENSTRDNNRSNSERPNRRFPRPFYPEILQMEYPVLRSRDPYRDALNSVQRGRPNGVEVNGTNEFSSEPFMHGAPVQFPHLQTPAPNDVLLGYQDGNRNVFSPFFPGSMDPSNRYQFLNPSQGGYRGADATRMPECAKKTNASMCFEDSDYPRREIMYSLNSDSYLIERFVGSPQGPEESARITENSDADEKYICRSDIKYGKPLRAKNALGAWKVIVNLESSSDGRMLSQPVRLEACSETDDPCSYTNSRVRTKCVQKLNSQRLLSWSQERGIHMDTYRFPVACACQIIESLET